MNPACFFILAYYNLYSYLPKAIEAQLLKSKKLHLCRLKIWKACETEILNKGESFRLGYIIENFLFKWMKREWKGCFRVIIQSFH